MERKEIKQAYRAANRIHQAYERRRYTDYKAEISPLLANKESWLHRGIDKIIDYRVALNRFAANPSAYRRIVRAAEAEVDKVLRRLKSLAGEAPGWPEIPTHRGIANEIMDLYEAYPDKVRLFKGGLGIETNEIVLESEDEGSFNFGTYLIVFPLTDPRSYGISKGKGNTDLGDGAIHPHVRAANGCLCEGQGKLAIDRAYQDGRLFDMVDVILSVLGTYANESGYGPYNNLNRWTGVGQDEVECGCGELFSLIDEGGTCATCGDFLCGSCSSSCDGCGEDLCESHIESCIVCRNWYCGGCMEGAICESCEETHEWCEDCTEYRRSEDMVHCQWCEESRCETCIEEHESRCSVVEHS